MKIQANIKKKFESGACRAIADVVFDGQFVARGFRVVEGEKGLFVAMPDKQTQNENGEKIFRDVFFPIKPESREQLVSAVLNAYENFGETEIIE